MFSYCYALQKYYLCNGIFAHFQEKLFVDVQSVSQMLAQYNSIIQSLSVPEVSIKLKSIREHKQQQQQQKERAQA